MAMTRSKFIIEVDMTAIFERLPHSADAKNEVIAALRKFCDRAETYGLRGNLLTPKGRVIGTAHVTRPRTVYPKGDR